MMEIAGKILLFSAFLIASISIASITALVFKIKYRLGSSFILLPTLALVSEDIRKNNKIRIFLKLSGVSLPMVILALIFFEIA